MNFQQAAQTADSADISLRTSKAVWQPPLTQAQTEVLLYTLIDAVAGLTALSGLATYKDDKQANSSPPVPVCASCEIPAPGKAYCFGLHLRICTKCLGKLSNGIDEYSSRRVRDEMELMMERLYPNNWKAKETA